MIVREMQRRCNFDFERVQYLKKLLAAGARGRNTHRPQDKLLMTLLNHHDNSGFLSARVISLIDIENTGLINHIHLDNLLSSLPAKPFEAISVH